MLRYVYGHNLHRHARLASSMFRDRAEQFRTRRGWDVTVDANGEERDEYDALDPLYVIWERADGTHGGSARFLPTTGPTMLADHFRNLTDGVAFQSPFIWECTRFCLAPGSGGRIASAIMLGGGELMRAFSLTHFVGVFDAPMVRVYSRIGASPEVLGTDGPPRERISAGLWPHDPETRARLCARCGIPESLSLAWFARDMPGAPGTRTPALAISA